MKFIHGVSCLIVIFLLAVSCREKETGEIVPLNTGYVYFPAWSGIDPVSTIMHAYNSGQTAAWNGTALLAAINALGPGQCLKVGTGNYEIGNYFDLTCSGTSASPVWIIGDSGAVITQTNTGENIINIGYSTAVSYLCIRGIELTGGSQGIRIYNCQNIWIDQCHIHHTKNAGLSANKFSTSYIYLTRNEINDTDGSGEGMYLGANYGAAVMSNSIIALNHVHHTNGTTVTQGDGIELKQGSWGNLIAENLVHDCGYPCIIVYGTDGKPQNIVERNICYNSNDNVMQVQGECIVRNNLLINGVNAGFASSDHQGSSANLQVIHNTIVNTVRAVNLNSWDAREKMVLANNVIYSKDAESIRFPNGSANVVMTGNVVYGNVTGALSGFVTTANSTDPLSDFTGLSWDASLRNGLPAAGSTIISAGNADYAVSIDITGVLRQSGLESGCYDRP